MNAPAPPLGKVAVTLAIAMVTSSTIPLLLLDGDLEIVAVSGAFCTAFGIDPATAAGVSMLALGSGEWKLPQLRVLLTATVDGGAEIDAYEIDLSSRDHGDRRLIVNAQKLHYDDRDGIRMLVAITDVTEARAHDREIADLIRDKALLLQELQHRVANSLQIVASILVQSARKAVSSESRGVLTDAHNRVMSIAAIQRQLAVSAVKDVQLAAYVTRLCQSIGASMIADASLLNIEVDVDDAHVDAETSVSIGLIVTELVINALKHAFPDGRRGCIKVQFRAEGGGWTLGIADDGIGMPPGQTAKAGLGTTIVQALVRQQAATITVKDGAPGTCVTVIHRASEPVVPVAAV